SSQTALGVRHHPYSLIEAPGRPVVLHFLSPLAKSEGDGAPSGASFHSSVPALPLGIAGAPLGAPPRRTLGRLGLFAVLFLTARAALFVGRRILPAIRQPSSWQAAPIGRRAEPRADPTHMTPHESAPRWIGRIGLYSMIGLKSSRGDRNFCEEPALLQSGAPTPMQETLPRREECLVGDQANHHDYHH